jgi:hypothetical protein
VVSGDAATRPTRFNAVMESQRSAILRELQKPGNMRRWHRRYASSWIELGCQIDGLILKSCQQALCCTIARF